MRTCRARAEIAQRHLVEPAAEIAGDHPAAGDDRQILQHRLAPMPVIRRMDRGHRRRRRCRARAQQRDDAGRRDLLGDDQQRAGSFAVTARIAATSSCVCSLRSVIRMSGSSSTTCIRSTSVTMWCDR